MYIGNGEIACDPPARLLSCSSIQLLRLWATATPSDSLGQPVDGCGKCGYLVVNLVGDCLLVRGARLREHLPHAS
jgi:hypothetical protein